MDAPERIHVFDSQGDAYRRAFEIFLQHTDQKRNAKRRLQRLVDGLAHRRVLIDAGAGNGEVTRSLAPAFARTIAVEPNAYLLEELRRAVPGAEVIPQRILDAMPPHRGDLVLCSHTLYYVPPEEWLAHLERLVSWMAPSGVVVVVLQNRGSGCMDMVHHFYGQRFELQRAADAFRARHGDRYEVVTDVDPAHVDTPELETTYLVAEFMLNLLEAAVPPTRGEVEAYLEAHFARPGGGYRIPVHQDFLQIRSR